MDNNVQVSILHTKKCKTSGNCKPDSVTCKVCLKKHHTKCHKIVIKNRYQSLNWTCWECLRVKRIGCTGCKKTIARSTIPVRCDLCNKPYHKKCSKSTSSAWACFKCLNAGLAFSKINNEEFICTINAINKNDQNMLNLLPSYTINSLLDKISAAGSAHTDEYLSETINSKYFSPIEFSKVKSPKHSLKVFFT